MLFPAAACTPVIVQSRLAAFDLAGYCTPSIVLSVCTTVGKNVNNIGEEFPVDLVLCVLAGFLLPELKTVQHGYPITDFGLGKVSA